MRKATLIILALFVVSVMVAQTGFQTTIVKITSQLWVSGTNVTSFFGYLNGSNQVTSSGIADGSIDDDKIAVNAVQNQHIEDLAVGWAEASLALRDSIRNAYAGKVADDTTTLKSKTGVENDAYFLTQISETNTDGTGEFILKSSTDYPANGKTTFTSPNASLNWVREEYLNQGIIKAEWFDFKTDGSNINNATALSLFNFADSVQIKFKPNATYKFAPGANTTIFVQNKSVFMEGHNTVFEFQNEGQQSDGRFVALEFRSSYDYTDTLKTKTVYRNYYFIRNNHTTMPIDSGAIVGLQVTTFGSPNPMAIGQYSWHTVRGTNQDTVFVREPIQYVWNPALGDVVKVLIINDPPSAHVKGITFTFAPGVGVNTGGLTLRGFRNILVENCKFHRTKRWGVRFYDFVNAKILNSEFIDIDKQGAGYCIAVENGRALWVQGNYMSRFRSAYDAGSGGPSDFFFIQNIVYGEDYLNNDFRLGGDHYGPEQTVIMDNIFRGLAIGLNLRGNHHIIKRNLFSAIGSTTGQVIQLNQSAGGVIIEENIFQDIFWKRSTVDSTLNTKNFIAIAGDSVTHHADPNVTWRVVDNVAWGIQNYFITFSSTLDNDTLTGLNVQGNQCWFDAPPSAQQRFIAGGSGGPIHKNAIFKNNQAYGYNSNYIKYDVRLDSASCETDDYRKSRLYTEKVFIGNTQTYVTRLADTLIAVNQVTDDTIFLSPSKAFLDSQSVYNHDFDGNINYWYNSSVASEDFETWQYDAGSGGLLIATTGGTESQGFSADSINLTKGDLYELTISATVDSNDYPEGSGLRYMLGAGKNSGDLGLGFQYFPRTSTPVAYVKTHKFVANATDTGRISFYVGATRSVGAKINFISVRKVKFYY